MRRRLASKRPSSRRVAWFLDRERSDQMDWTRWRSHFDCNRGRPLPDLAPPAGLSVERTRLLASSLARFALGETGEGRIARQIHLVRWAGIDDAYREALGLFIKEEGRHARILGEMVRVLGGQLVRRAWSQGAFVLTRRLLGLRFKLLAMLAAEVVGIGFYGLLASGLPAGPFRDALRQICDDESAHLRFHRDLFRTQTAAGWRRALFRIGWAAVAPAAVLVVWWDHRKTLRAFGIPLTQAAATLAGLMVQGGML
jgi:hypothetical protein